MSRLAARSVLWLVLLHAAQCPLAASANAFEGPPADTELGPTFLLSLGGKLYDDFWRVLDWEPPGERNPAIPASAALPVAGDLALRHLSRLVLLRGNIGGVSFPGLRSLAGAEPESIRARILDPAHPFPAEDIPELSLDILAFFIRDGLYDRADFLEPTGRAMGNPEFGRDIFEGACINCHQLDGRRYLKGERGDRSSLGWVARYRPEQALHKILNGVPAAEMLSLRFLSTDQVADLLAYLQTLDAAEK